MHNFFYAMRRIDNDERLSALDAEAVATDELPQLLKVDPL